MEGSRVPSGKDTHINVVLRPCLRRVPTTTSRMCRFSIRPWNWMDGSSRLVWICRPSYFTSPSDSHGRRGLTSLATVIVVCSVRGRLPLAELPREYIRLPVAERLLYYATTANPKSARCARTRVTFDVENGVLLSLREQYVARSKAK